MTTTEVLIGLSIFNISVLIFAFKTKWFLFTKTPEQQWQPILSEFDKNKIAMEGLDLSDYTLGSGNIYQ